MPILQPPLLCRVSTVLEGSPGSPRSQWEFLSHGGSALLTGVPGTGTELGLRLGTDQPKQALSHLAA